VAAEKIGVVRQEKRGGGEIASPSSSRRVLWLPEFDGVGKTQIIFLLDVYRYKLSFSTREPHHFM
jgi:hypothetical protein